MNKTFLISIILFSIWGYSQEKGNTNIDNFLNQIDNSDLLMGSVSISKAGNEIYQSSIGYKDIEKNFRNSIQTKYRIGSISKSFTATMIMQLIEEKKLSLNDKIASFIPEIPNSNIISIEQLLKHKSGLFNITLSPNFFTWMEHFHTKKEIIDLIIANRTVFSPGKKTEYSNTNYILLSLILEIIEKKSYAAILTERIIIPCGLKNTYYGGEISSNENEAFSYTYVNQIWNKATITDMSVPIGAGAIVSTPSDLNSFYFQLFNGKLLSQNSLDKMTGSKNLYEFALYPVISYDSKICFGHEGRIDGFHAFAAYFPEDSISISFCSNGEYGYLKETLLQILNCFFNPNN